MVNSVSLIIRGRRRFDRILNHQMTALMGALLMAVALLLPATSPAYAQSSDQNLYRLGSGDKVLVTVFRHEDLSGEFEVDGVGNVSLPLIGTLRAGGLSINELERAIIAGLRPDYLVNPQVSVAVTNYRPFYILGEVNAPGSYAFVNGMTVLNAVALAGGYTYRAREGRVNIERHAPGREAKFVGDAGTFVLPGDVIEVSERFF